MGVTGTEINLWHVVFNITLYTLLAIGVMYAIFFTLKKNPSKASFLTKMTLKQNGLQSKYPLSVESSLRLELGKNLYVVQWVEERFLISTSNEGSQFISKLEGSIEPSMSNQKQSNSQLLPGIYFLQNWH